MHDALKELTFMREVLLEHGVCQRHVPHRAILEELCSDAVAASKCGN